MLTRLNLTSDDCFDNAFRLMRISDPDRDNAGLLGRIVVAAREQGIPDKDHLFNGNAQNVS